MSIRKRENGWEYTIELGKDPATGKRKRKAEGGFKTKKECEAAMHEVMTKVNKGEYFEPDKLNIKEYLDYWHETYVLSNTAPSTQKRYKEFCNSISDYLGGMQLFELKPAHIQRFYANIKNDRELSNSTVLKIHRMLSMALKHAVGWQMLISNPAIHVQAPRPEDIDMKIWDIETVNRFLDDIKDESIYMPVLIAVQTGMRQGEVCGLLWNNINTADELLSVRYTLQNIKGKGLILKKPKTKNSIRNISLIKATTKALKEHNSKQKLNKVLLGEEYNDDGYVCSWEDGRPMDPHYVCQKFKELVEKLDYPIIRFHDLRHTHATMLLQAGVHPKIVSERLGHSSINITLDLYSHVLPNMQREAADKLNNAFPIAR